MNLSHFHSSYLHNAQRVIIQPHGPHIQGFIITAANNYKVSSLYPVQRDFIVFYILFL
jgi:hypothetical protein